MPQTMSKSEGLSLKVPYVQILPEGLKDQTLIAIYGVPKPNAEGFEINICNGTDIAFQFNPRFNEDGKQVIVRNTRINGFWGSEERELPVFPFTPGKPFEIKILCTSSGFRVEVDNNHLLNYTHRVKELDQITHLHIHQDIFLERVHVDGFFLKVPYVQILPEGLKDKTLIKIYGEPKESAEKFDINICNGTDIAFHFNPRFNEDGKQVIVRNSLINDVWGPEEKELLSFPFTPGKPFEIKILCTSSGYRVKVDNNNLLNYAHRMKELDQITHIHIHRDVLLKYVQIAEDEAADIAT
ncbi:galectin-4-like [Colossoma macropomum]|uniref:galectin-4-like n=1 Tax=Colossoma macropomum TaxID=42526 RepID=UPI0018649766|nr:galectin-4-like [Colossoma macropomum]